jgi:hypothetical protein
LATLVQKAVTKPAENNSQFAVWLLKWIKNRTIIL